MKKTIVEEIEQSVSTIQSDMAARRSGAEAKRMGTLYKQALKALDEAQAREDAWLQIHEHRAPIKLKPQFKPSIDEAVGVLMLSDIHFEERVDPATVNGRNEYNPDIARARLAKFRQNSLSLVRKERNLARIKHLVLWWGGDMMTGHIHEELKETNWLHPVEAIEQVRKELVDQLGFLLDHGDFSGISVVCNYGNHGRTTEKMRISNAHRTSYEWMMYRSIAQQFAGEKRVKFQIADGYLEHIQVLETNLRTHHGDGLKYQGGIGGMTVPLNRKVASLNQTIYADWDLLGHFHSLMFLPRATVNGSVIGPSAYAVKRVNAPSEVPQQAFFLVAKGRGPTCFNRVFCE